MLLPSGHMKGDLTVMRLAADRFMIVGSGYLQEFHMLWFEQHAGGRRMRIVNRSEDLTTIAIAGPRSRELMRAVATGNVEREAMGFMSVRRMDVGLAPCLVARLSFTGELGFEIYVPPSYAGGVYDLLMAEGAKLGIRRFGTRALVSLGMEKSFGIWSREFTPDYTPVMCGMDRWIAYDKADFVGREAALADRDAEHEHKLVALEIDSIDADAWGYETRLPQGRVRWLRDFRHLWPHRRQKPCAGISQDAVSGTHGRGILSARRGSAPAGANSRGTAVRPERDAHA